MLFRLMLVLSSCVPVCAFAQWAGSTSMTIDGNNNESSYVADGAWNICWDDTYIYVCKTGGSANEPAIMYFDIDPVFPVTGGGNGDGNVTGNTDYGITPNCPFRADARLYMTTSYAETRNRDGTGGWSSANNITSDLANNGSSREVRISWSSFPGVSGRTSTIRFFGFACTISTSPGDIYDQTPSGNTSGSGYSTPNCEYYWRSNVTSSSGTENPFNYNNYTYLGTGGSLATISDIYDFTLNSSGITVNKADKWIYNGYMVVADGTIEFDANDDSLIIEDSLVVMNSGKFDMESSTSTVWVKSHFNNRATGSGTDVTLSSNDTARLVVAGNFWNTGDFSSEHTTVALSDHKSTQVLQTVLGSLSGNDHLYRLEVNNGMGVRIAVDDSVVIEDSLAYLDGVIQIDDGKSLRLRDTCVTNDPGNPDDGRYIDGVLVREIYGTTATTFHVGDNSRMSRVVVQPSSSQSGRTYAVKHYASGHEYNSSTSATRGVPGNGLDHVSYNEYWSITCNHSTDDATLTLYWTSESVVSSTTVDRDSLRVCRWTAGSTNEWSSESSTVTVSGSEDDGYVQSGSASTTFADSFFTLGTLSANNPLPADLLWFNAQRENENSSTGSWGTTNEINCDRYEIWMLDGPTASLLYSTAAYGTRLETSYYDFSVSIPNQPVLLKLKLIDFDGSESWLDEVYLPLHQKKHISVYPNPARDEILFNFPKKDSWEIRLYNSVGQCVLDEINKQSIDVSALPTGSYILQIKTRNGTPIFRKVQISSR